MPATLLVELLTEELPPKSLRILGEAFASALFFDLQQSGFVADGGTVAPFCTPRRLAASLTKVLERSPDSEREVQGPPVSAASQAIEGFARKCGVAVAALEKRKTPKGEVYVARVTSKGRTLEDALAPLVDKSLKSLPVAKLMRWGAGASQFVRPVHGLVMMHGTRAVPGSVLGVSAGSTTRGHRFLGVHSIALAGADEYAKRLRDEGMVIADFAARRKEIEKRLHDEAKRQKADLGDYESLLDEVTALVELPSVYVGHFDAAYLAVPPECLILTMRQNQKYFPLFGAGGELLPRFLVVSNMRAKDPRRIVSGNERVVRPRLEDARFFYDQDRKARLEARVPRLAQVVYHAKLGSQLERAQRIKQLAGRIARELKIDPLHAERAAELAKADLLTGMVGEFPELQGLMGRYYALQDGEPRDVADAIGQHYRPRFAGDGLPETPIACAVALADKFDALAGLFSIGEQPTGEKDPFGLRRAALGAIRILVERRLSLSLKELIHAAFEPFAQKSHVVLRDFLFDRFAGYLKELGYSTLQVEAVLAKMPVHLGIVPQQLEAVKAFQSLPEAESLAAANKRVANILKQAEAKGENLAGAAPGELRDPAEKELQRAIRAAYDKAKPLYDKGDYAGYLKTFSVLKTPVDAFFDKVMVMVDDDTLRRGRLALLRDLREAMNRVADIAKLAA